MKLVLLLSVLVILVYREADTAHNVCNRSSLTKVTVKAYVDPRYRAATFTDIDLQGLEGYERLDVIKANVSGQLCTRMIVNFPKLAELTLMNANITDIEINAIDEVPNLRMLSMSLNKLSNVKRGQFNNIPMLERLYLSANVIETVDGNAFNDMIHLEKIYLDRNRISTLNRDWFLNCPRLKLVDMSYNRITYLPPDSFRNLVMDQGFPIVYVLRHNEINSIHDHPVEKNIPLVLHLEGNNLRWILPVTLESFSHCYAVYLNKNELECSTIEALDSASQGNSKTIFHYDNSTCRKYVE